MNVPWWINTIHKELKMYVANRKDVILNHTEAEQWRHVGSHEHPADIASRGALLKDLLGNNLWWQGPDSFELDEKDWPAQPSLRSPMRLRENSKQKSLLQLYWYIYE
jgi:hypothetical protein